MERTTADVVVVGGGLAGLWAVLHLPVEWDVLVVDKGGTAQTGSSPWAQGGMAVAVGPDDSPELHAADTIHAGAGTCSGSAVEVLVDEAPAALEELVRLGCEFDRSPDGSLDLNREGGQTVPRSVHAADATGREIMRVVLAHAQRRARRLVGTVVRIVERDGACRGVVVDAGDTTVAVGARGVLLATGGCGGLYEATTNPPGSTGDGVALAYEAGANVADLEFVQFHPTALATSGHRRILLTEALRGDGAVVVDHDGTRFLLDSHPAGELGPRDVVARAIAARPQAYLDARPIGAARLRSRFPNVTAAVADAGFDLTTEPVPVSPAVHYSLGGVATDVWGRSSLEHLYAAGECATTGVHGANRMAGNSLTEAVVFGRRAALAMARECYATPDALDPKPVGGTRAPAERWADLRKAMTSGAGLVRTDASLARAAAAVAEAGDTDDRTLALACRTAGLICRAAQVRAESRGTHHRDDHPEPLDAWSGVRLSMAVDDADRREA